MTGGWIDVHHHLLPPPLVEVMDAAGIVEVAGRERPEWSPQLSLEVMDRQGIDTALLSVSATGVYFGDDAAAATARPGLQRVRLRARGQPPWSIRLLRLAAPTRPRRLPRRGRTRLGRARRRRVRPPELELATGPTWATRGSIRSSPSSTVGRPSCSCIRRFPARRYPRPYRRSPWSSPSTRRELPSTSPIPEHSSGTRTSPGS